MSTQTPIFEKKNVLITGGAGFIGSHLCERLLRDAKVICMDDLSGATLQSVEHLLQYPDFEFVKYDVNQPIDLTSFPELEKFRVKFQGVQEVYHLACPTSPKRFEENKMACLRAHAHGVLSTLELARDHHAAYLYASTSVVYGHPTADRYFFSEDDHGDLDHLSFRACYDEGKQFGETCVATYKQVHGLDTKIARIFPTYGPRMPIHEGQLIPDFILHAILGEDLVIYGDGDLDQSLCYVSDMVDGLVRLMQAGGDAWVANLGSDEIHKMQDVAKKIIAMTSSSSAIAYAEPLPFLSKKGIPDLRRAKESLGWIPVVTLDEGLRKTIDYTIANKELLGL